MLQILTADGQIREPLKRYLLRMTRTGDNTQLLLWNVKAAVQIVRNNHVLIGYHSLHCRDNYLVRHVTTNLVKRLPNIRRRDSQNQDIRLRNNAVDIGGETDTTGIKLRNRQI